MDHLGGQRSRADGEGGQGRRRRALADASAQAAAGRATDAGEHPGIEGRRIGGGDRPRALATGDAIAAREPDCRGAEVGAQGVVPVVAAARRERHGGVDAHAGQRRIGADDRDAVLDVGREGQRDRPQAEHERVGLDVVPKQALPVSFTCMGPLPAVLAGRGRLDLDAPVSTCLTALLHAAEISVRMLANMTSGCADHVYQPQVLGGTDANPFRQWTNDELIRIGVTPDLMFTPGTNCGYSHTNYVILGEVVEHLTQRPLAAVMDEMVLQPMGLRNTLASSTPDHRGRGAVDRHHRSRDHGREGRLRRAGDPGALRRTDRQQARLIGRGDGSVPCLPNPHGRPRVRPGRCCSAAGSRRPRTSPARARPWRTCPNAGSPSQVATTLRPEAYDDQGAARDPGMTLLRRLGAVLAPDRPVGPP